MAANMGYIESNMAIPNVRLAASTRRFTPMRRSNCKLSPQLNDRYGTNRTITSPIDD